MTDGAGPLEFGFFIPPMHYPQQNPTRSLQRDLETLVYGEALGFTEAWIGEHHSGGYEIIGAPEVFVAAAVERTKRMKVGTGVVSLPYHHPFHVAQRAVLLDHLSMGRTMLGVGPGSLPSDAAMQGIPWSETRTRFQQSFEAIHHLLTSDEPLTVETDWFTLRDAVLQVRPFTQPLMDVAFTAMESPFGPSLAGKWGAGLISLSALSAPGYSALARHWGVVEEQADRHGQTVDRNNWRVVTMIHVAETREQAKREVALGLPRFATYSLRHSERASLKLPASGSDGPGPQGIPDVDDVIDILGSQIACIGTPDDAIAMIQNLIDTTGGFGKVLLFSGADWASQQATFRSLELFAREVMPAFQGSSVPMVRAAERNLETREQRVSEQRASIEKAKRDYEAAGKDAS